MSNFVPSRRAVIRTAAWSVPAVTVASAAPAFAASPVTPTYQTVTTDPLPFNASGVTGSMGTWTVVLTAEVPDNLPVGTIVAPLALTAVVTIPDAARAGIAGLGVTTVSGSATAPYVVGGQAGPLTATLAIPELTVPAAGDFVITTTGNSATFTAGTAGTFTMELQDIVCNLTVAPPVLGFISETSVNLARAGAAADYTFATFTVA